MTILEDDVIDLFARRLFEHMPEDDAFLNSRIFMSTREKYY